MTFKQPRWQQPPSLSQPPNWGLGAVHNPWGNAQNNPIGQLVYQQVPQPPPQQPSLPPYMGGPPPANGPTGNLMPRQYYQPQPVN